ncbi:uncharacterized protein BXZ73DRAFT_96876 [Epithele typhae]|uniref:uncharacterized protein n=1 Tax=Epithele typhae TaxID=378194 RepID=UPI00200782CB|nr:uncharacterized protein BXZ73DRAFT_96876 [Epithele typhae]KAH9944387.1 hypothetical protein BXZ73DRAFT_96876 [Epithele typhae]
MTLFARLLVVAAALPLALATSNSGWGNSGSSSSCKSNEFYWGDKDCCLPHGGSSKPPSPPKGSSCPSTPSCSSGWGWNSGKSCCTPAASTTVKTTAHPTTSVKTTSVHTTSAPPATTSSTCGSGQWYWGSKSCCLPHGGSPNPPSPPSGTDCPSNWEWNHGKGCCVPHHPDQPPPQCGNGWGWNSGSFCCNPHTTTSTKPATPSKTPSSGNGGYGWGNTGNSGYGWGNSGNGHKGGWKRSHKARSTSVCPAGMEACLTSTTGLSDNFECVDTSSDLESCGGCASVGAGEDCTAITGSKNVGCRAGECVVLTCASGFLKSVDNKTCVKV